MIFIHAFARSAYNYAVLATFAILPAEVLADVSAPGVSAGTMLQTGLGLLLVFGLLFAAAYLLRKFNPGRGFGRNGPLRVVGGLMISTRERIVLLEVGDVWLVVGVGPGQIRTLHTMPKGEALPGTPDEKPFGQWLKQIIEHKNEAR